MKMRSEGRHQPHGADRVVPSAARDPLFDNIGRLRADSSFLGMTQVFQPTAKTLVGVAG